MVQIKDVLELRKNYKEPSARAANKTLYQLDQHAQKFIELSSYFTVSSTDSSGFIDT